MKKLRYFVRHWEETVKTFCLHQSKKKTIYRTIFLDYQPHCELCWIYLEQTMFVSSKVVTPNSFGDNFFHLKKSPSTKHCWWSLCERAKSGLASSRPAEIPFYTISAILQRVQLKTIAMMGFSSILRYIFTSNRRIPC